jgi:GTPase SAR1 family protein
MIKINKKENNIYHTDNKINDGIYIIKILIIGDEGVGKSNFIYRYIKDQFSESYLSSAGFDSNSKEIEITEKKVIDNYGILLDKDNLKL